MTRKPIATVLKALAVTFLWGLILFADFIWGTSAGFLGSITREVTAACRDSQTQWMVVLCLASYFVMLLFLERRLVGGQRAESRGRISVKFLGNIFNPNLWLGALVVLVLVSYACNYKAATH